MKAQVTKINSEIAKYINLYHKMTAPLIDNISQGNFVLGKLQNAKKIETRPQKLAWLNKQIKRVANVRNNYQEQLSCVKKQLKF